jgi:hypothetical protein
MQKSVVAYRRERERVRKGGVIGKCNVNINDSTSEKKLSFSFCFFFYSKKMKMKENCIAKIELQSYKKKAREKKLFPSTFPSMSAE